MSLASIVLLNYILPLSKQLGVLLSEAMVALSLRLETLTTGFWDRYNEDEVRAMLDEKDLRVLSDLMDQKISKSESRMAAFFEASIAPKFDLLADGQAAIQEKLVPRSRMDDLEDEVRFLKSVIRQMNDDLQKLKKAQ